MLDLSKFVSTLNGKAVYVYGLGKSGLASVKALQAAEAIVWAWDGHEEQRLVIQNLGVELCSETDADFSKIGCVLLSPGVPLTHPEPHPVVKLAQEHRIEVIGDIEVLGRCLPPTVKTIGVTGTNGKSTTTALIAHILNATGHYALTGGNIGVPALSLDLQAETEVLVLELSSYQIDLCSSFHPDIGILLNVTPDHLDRHGTIEHYSAAKARMFGHHTRPIISIEDFFAKEIYEVENELGKAPIPLDLSQPLPFETVDLKTLVGRHNHQNALAAWHACRQLNISEEAILSAMKTFPGLAHRQQIIRQMGRVTFINDSKATNAEATAKALEAYRNIYLILGGVPKTGGLNGIEDFLPNVRKAYLIGEAAAEFSEWLTHHQVAFEQCLVLQNAVTRAAQEALNSGEEVTVLLSPACASWDQFKSFEHRGDVFKKLVTDLRI